VSRPLSVAVLYAAPGGSQTLSYQVGWPAALARNERFDTALVNTVGRAIPDRLAQLRATRRRGLDAIVVLHSVFSNGILISRRLCRALERSSVPVVYFVGNEYKLMPQKMAFAERIGTRLVVSQSTNRELLDLYEQRLGCRAVGIPAGALDTEVFRPLNDFRQRPIDLGMRAADEPLYFGHQDRKTIAEFFGARAGDYGLRVDISFDVADRFDRAGYNAFLNRCRGQLGTEGGTDYFELTDKLRREVIVYGVEHPGEGLEEYRSRLFDSYEGVTVSGRIITGRHAEAAGTKTVQLLFEGIYGGFFEPDVHYIPLRRDLSNADEAVAKLRDDGYCARIVENAYEVATTELTYDRLIRRLEEAMLEVLER
jgi:hypothetical protein